MPDRELILRKLALLAEYGDQLDEFRNIGIAAYKADWKIRRIIDHTLQLMIEVCLDIGQHIIADNSLRTPTSNADIFDVLREGDVLTPRTCLRIRDMAKFRNIVVHNYEKVSAEIVVGILEKHLGDFRLFERNIVRFLNRTTRPNP